MCALCACLMQHQKQMIKKDGNNTFQRPIGSLALPREAYKAVYPAL